MTATERDFVTTCIAEIEARYFPEKAREKVPLSQRNLQFLIDQMEERSNIRISLSTMKRLWKKDFNKMPHPSTLDALVSLLGYEDWNIFRQKQGKPLLQDETVAVKSGTPSKTTLLFSVLGAIVLTLLLISLVKKKKEVVIPANIPFSANQTKDLNVPNSVIFSYDLTEVEADSFFVQRSWNPSHKTRIDPEKKNFSEIYYYPGFHWARLIANDQVVQKTRIHVKTDGWFATTKSERLQNVPIYPNQAEIVSNGTLNVKDSNLIESGVDLSKNLILSFFNIREFAELQSNAFELETRVRYEDIQGLICPFMEMKVIDEKDASWVSIISQGCESNLLLKAGSQFFKGAENDFSSLGVKMDEWQILKVISKDGFLQVYLNGEFAYEMPFPDATGKIMGLIFTFTGKGVIDYVSLKDLNGKILYSDEFDNP
ncbi:hypothetical protein [Flagellimonas allohymeniacidonis]|uniref:Uncharacterized protein n=1 Tax=Flagellimonas allohymeniacidonis TaxID=2517819 RepID=A0A4Q8QEZ0_9FLAO|nr:hypothetical protein [Allomuricauda hymeniacidonis]TAI47758.1 hypothetical protein EW142_13960 [Allomuricauda hymeniacidonis]